MYQKCKVVLLPTNQKALIFLYYLDGIKNGVSYLASRKSLDEINHPYDFQHLYILSTEKIKKNDWVYDYTNRIHPLVFINEDGSCNDASIYLKVIASTDSLFIIDAKGGRFIPQPSQSFIEKYVQEYNKGNKIEDVMVEYEEYAYLRETNTLRYKSDVVGIWEPKVNPKDNTITIKRVKDSWSREEVISLFGKAQFDGIIKPNVTVITYDNWIKENI